jgi:chorismate synthase
MGNRLDHLFRVNILGKSSGAAIGAVIGVDTVTAP